MKKYLTFVLVCMLITPFIASASWWNPFSWKIFNRTKIINPISIPVSTTQTEGEKTSTPESKLPIYKEIKKEQKASSSDSSKIIDTQEFCDEYVPGEVLGGVNTNISTKDLFDLFSERNMKITSYDGLFFSSLSSDKIAYIKNELSKKKYIPTVWKPNAFVHTQTGQLIVTARLEKMNSVDQEDWLKTMQMLQLTENRSSFRISGLAGKEKENITFFKNNPMFKYAELNCIVHAKLN